MVVHIYEDDVYSLVMPFAHYTNDDLVERDRVREDALVAVFSSLAVISNMGEKEFIEWIVSRTIETLATAAMAAARANRIERQQEACLEEIADLLATAYPTKE